MSALGKLHELRGRWASDPAELGPSIEVEFAAAVGNLTRRAEGPAQAARAMLQYCSAQMDAAAAVSIRLSALRHAVASGDEALVQ